MTAPLSRMLYADGFLSPLVGGYETTVFMSLTTEALKVVTSCSTR